MERKSLLVDKLILSDGNPRLDPSFGEDEAIAKMINNQGDKLVELAFDIKLYGLSPLDAIGVYPSESYKGLYEVGEGNRRLCALKLLINPERAQSVSTNIFSKFSDLSESYTPPQSLDVVLFDSAAEMNHWMEIRHMGEQNGKGLSKWNSIQKARFNRIQTGSDALLDFWDWMTENSILTNDEIMSVTKTNWQRILREKYYPFLKIQYDGKYNVDTKDLYCFTERIRAIQSALKEQTVAIVYDQEQIEKFYNNISNALYNIPYEKAVERDSDQISITTSEDTEHIVNISDQPVTSSEDDDFSQNDADNDIRNSQINIEETSIVVGKDCFNGSSTIIPYGYSIRSSNMRLNKIINELKRLNPDEYPNACGTLLRALFELSAKVYLEKERGTDQTSVDFKPAIQQAANILRSKSKIKNEQHSAITHDVDELRKIFNGYMHNTDSYPSSVALKNIFKAHLIFIQECLK